MTPRIFLALVVAVGWVGAGSAVGTDRELEDLSVSNALGGPAVLSAIRTSPRIIARRVDQKPAPDRSASQPPAPPTPPDQLIPLGEPFELSDDLADSLRATLTTGKTYLGVPKRCLFRANVLLTFSPPGERPVELVFCFGCGELQVWQEGKMIAFSPFDGGYSPLSEFAKAAFPNDPYLLTLSDAAFRERWLENAKTPPPD